MSELERILLTSSLTVLSGVVIFVIGQWVLRVWIEPLQDQRRTIHKIACSLINFANVGSNVYDHYFQGLEKIESDVGLVATLTRDRKIDAIKQAWHREDEASRELRSLAAELSATTNGIPMYSLLAFFLRRPAYPCINAARASLIRFSNQVHSSGDHTSDITLIARNLRLNRMLDS